MGTHPGQQTSRWLRRSIVLVAIGAGATMLTGGAAARAQPQRDAVEEALDRKVDEIKIQNVQVRDALAALEKRTGIAFSLSDATVDLLPYGARTQVSIVLKDTSVRHGMTRIFDGLGLAMSVAGDRVEVEPAPVLRRLGRRMTINEVEVLIGLAEDSWAARRGKLPPLQFEIDPATQPAEALERAIAQTPAPNAVRQLEAACATLGWVWVPREGAVLFSTRRAFVGDLLNRPLHVNYTREPLDTMLEDVGRRAGVRVAFDPGVLQSIAARDRVADLVSTSITARQVLDRVCGNTGLHYELNDEGVRVFSGANGATPSGVSPVGPAAPATSRVVFMIEKPLGDTGMSVNVLVREDELPPDILSWRESVLAEVLAELREIHARREREAAQKP